MIANNEQWKGSTLDELRYRRALVGARVEIEKYRLNALTEQYRRMPQRLTGSTSLVGRVMGAFSYAEYAILGFKLIKRVSKLMRGRRRR